MPSGFATVALVALLAAACEGQYVADSVDVLFNLTLSGIEPGKIDMSGVNGTELVARLAAMAEAEPAKYAQLASAVFRDVSDGAVANSVSVSECLAGSYVHPVTGMCTACRAGTYSETARATSASVCVACVAGKFSNVTGASTRTTCESCPVGTFSSVVGANTSSVCMRCPPGMTSAYGADGGLQCLCLAGFYASSTGPGCVECEPGYFCGGGNRSSCPFHANGVSTSLARASALSDCFCMPGYFGLAGFAVGCELCHVNNYCPGEVVSDQYTNNYAVMKACPEHSYSDVGASSRDQCLCQNSYRRSVSTPASRSLVVTAQACNCTNTFQCPSSGCVGCSEVLACPAETRLTCRQGYLSHVGTSTTAGAAGYPASANWLIAPAGATRVWIRVFDVNTGDSRNTLRLLQCVDTNCDVTTTGPLTPTALTGEIPLRTFVTSMGTPVVKVVWTGIVSLPVTTPFRIEYGSSTECEWPTTVPLTVAGVSYLIGGEVESSPAQVDPSWPLVVWVGDIVSFTEYPTSAAVAVNVVAGSPTGKSVTDGYAAGQVGYLASWQPTSAGLFYVVDLAMAASRNRALWVLPAEKREVTVYYTFGGVGGTSFTLSGAVQGEGSPDIPLVVGDKLVMTRLSGTSGVVLLMHYDAGNAVHTAMTGSDVVGQSTAALAHTSVTWDTSGRPPGMYWYASASNLGGVRVGRVLLYAPPGGSQCVQCEVGEYCYDGAAVKCPPNSVSPVGSTSASQCLCSKGFARAATDLVSYVNGQAVDSGGRHSCVVDEAGSLWCWGANEKGQLGQGAGVVSVSEATPLRVLGADGLSLDGVRNVSLGEDFTCAVVGAAQRVKCWGSNFYGQLGLDSSAEAQEFAGEDARLGGTDTGTGAANAYTALGLSCGGHACCAIIAKGSVEAVTCWGRGERNQLGQGATESNKRKNVGTGGSNYPSSNSRYSYADMGLPSLSFGSDKAELVTMGGEHACAVMVSGTVYCWGYNFKGAVGQGSGLTFFNPTIVDVGGAAKTVNCWGFVCCAVMKGTYRVKCWGRGEGGRLGVGLLDVGTTEESMGANLQPVNLGKDVLAMDVNVGGTQTCALLANNAVKCWGLVGGSVIGDNPPVEMSDVLPNVPLLGTRVVLQLSGKGAATCAVMSDYRVACWGSNEVGQLGGTPVAGSGGMNMTIANLNVLAMQSSGTPSQLSCLVCSESYYCPGGQSLPQTCPANTLSAVQSWQVSDCKCQPGFKKVGSVCVLCSGAEYCLGGVAYSCGSNSMTAANGSSDASQCQCARGYFRNVASGACVACAMGQYKESVSNAESCALCPAGTKSSQTALGSLSGCGPCGAGSFSEAGATACTGCAAGTAAGVGSSACVACGAGFFSDGNEATCRPCPAGTFDEEPRNGQPGTCSSCVAGTFSGVTNATSGSVCRPCAAGTVSEDGAGSCRPCGEGEFSLEGTRTCQACPANSTSGNGSAYSGCRCLAGYLKRVAEDGVTFTCGACGAGRFSASGATACESCPAGSASGAAVAGSAASCVPCVAGRFAAADGSSACEACPASSFAAGQGTAVCTNCTPGFWAGAQSTVCNACVPGKFAPGPISSAGGCVTCPAGSFCVGGLESVKPGKQQVAACPIGTFSTELGLSSVAQCLACPANFFCPSPTLKGACPAGTVSNASSVSQLQCGCVEGYSCKYTKVVNAVVTLQMSAADFQANKAVQDAFRQAVAQAARTTMDKVQIVKVVASAGSGGGGRRLLGAAEEAHVMLEIVDGEGRGLGLELDARLRLAGLRASREGHRWIEPHAVVAKKMA